tara:strand:- start:265 stop:516 length:252 start_codon:yes stop_codon:yes gene_type:complete
MTGQREGMFIFFFPILSKLPGIQNVEYNILETTGMRRVHACVSFQVNIQQKANVSGRVKRIFSTSFYLSNFSTGSIVSVSGPC